MGKECAAVWNAARLLRDLLFAGKNRQVVLLLFGTMFISGTETLIITPVLPQMAADLNVSIELAGHWVTAYAVVTGIFAFVFGPISDQTERKTILVIGLFVLGVGTVACGFCDRFWTLAGARGVVGAGAGMLLTSCTSYVADRFDAEHRGTAMGLVMNGFFVSLILGVPAGAGLANAAGWRPMFWMLGAMIFVWVGALALWLPALGGHRRPDDGVFEPRSGRIRAVLAGYGQIVRLRHVWGVLQTAGLVGLSMTMYSVYLSPWLEETYGFDTLWRGLVYAIGAPAAVVAAPLAGRWSAKVGRLPVIVLGNLLTMTTVICVALSAGFGARLRTIVEPSSALARPLELAPLFFFSFLLLASSAARSTAVQTMSTEAVEPRMRGSMEAFKNFFFQAAVALGATFGSILWAGEGDRFFRICLWALGLTGVSTGLLIWLSRDAPGALPKRAAPLDAG